MSDTVTCSNCGTEVPSAASFCTGCGQQLAAAAPAPPPPAPVDAPADVTQIETPGLNDATQVTPPPPSAPAPSPYAPPPPPPPPASAPGPWGPSAPAPPAAAPWAPPTATGSPAAPPAPSAPSWHQPAPPPSPGSYPPAGPPSWTAPGSVAAAPWGTGPEVASPPEPGGSVLGGIIGLIGAVLAIVGIFSGWVKLGSTGTVTAWSLTGGEGLLETQTPYVILILAAASVVVSLVLFTGIARTPARILAILLGLAIVGVTAANWAEIASYVTDNFPSTFEATTAIGFYFTIAGGVLVIVSALMPAKKK